MSRIGKLRKHSIVFIILILSSALSGCASMAEEVIETLLVTTARAVVYVTVEAVVKPALGAAVACIDNDKPVLSGALPNPVLNQEYDGIINVSIRNEPYDDSYDYTFELFGDLPPGMTTENHGRQIRLVGTPTMSGEYNFKIRVKVEDGRNGENRTKGLCYTVDNEIFHWKVQQAQQVQYL